MKRRSAVRIRSAPRPLDQRSVAEAFSFPGNDPRQWISYGTVDAEDSVVFDEEYGPLVSVTLQPTKVQVQCRVGSDCAGNGEGAYNPFVVGDEVLVAIPEGSEKSDCVILCRLNNSIDKFPMGSVAGQDPTTNTFGFRRQRTPYVHEIAGPFTMRQATTEALLAFDTKGVVTIKDGQKSALQMSPDVFGFVSGDGKFTMQIDLTGSRYTLMIDDAVLTISSSSASPQTSALNVPGTFAMSTNANPAAEHVLTTEAFVNLFVNLLVAAGAVATPSFSFIPLPPDPTSPIYGAIATALGAAGQTPLASAVAAALFGAFAGATPKPPGLPGQGQLKPGIGCVGFLAG